MKSLFLSLFCVGIGIAAFAQKKPVAKPVSKPALPAAAFKNLQDSASYALGMRVAQSFKSQGIDPINMSLFQKGVADALQSKKPVIDDALLDQCIGTYQQNVMSEKSIVVKKQGLAFLEANGKRKNIITLPSGIQYEIIKTGTETAKPTLASTVKCHYHGTLINGEVFDSSVDRGQPITYPLAKFIQGWQEVLQLMTIGSKWKVYIPSDLAYGDRASGKIPGGSVLIFDLELLGIE